jgi:hypothetical protein
MRKILLVITKPLNPLDEVVIAHESHLPGCEVKSVDLTTEEPDYRALIHAIFAADSIQVW